MGILDRFTSLMSRRDQTKIDPKGPLGLLPGDTLSHYETRYQVSGTRVQLRGERLVYQYRLRGEDNAVAVLIAGGDVADGFLLERVRTDLSVDWQSDVQTGPEEEQFRLVDEGACAVRNVGEATTGQSSQVRYRIFEDEESGQILTLEDRSGSREVRMGDPVFEGELDFHGAAGPTEERAWDVEVEDCDEQGTDADADDVTRGSPLAAALALEGRFASSATDPSTFSEKDATEFVDAEWSDADEIGSEIASIMGVSETGAFSDTGGWLEPTLYVAGAERDAPPATEDDWLVRDSA